MIKKATSLLQNSVKGDTGAVNRLLPLVYNELRNLALRHLKRERPGHTLEPTALVHEAYLKLIDAASVDLQGRTHFFALAAKAIRQVLIQYARARGAQKREGWRRKITLNDTIAIAPSQKIDLHDLDEALSKLAAIHERQARVVELRFFGGLSVEEIAAALGVSDRTVKGDWRVTRAWLKGEIDRADHGGE